MLDALLPCCILALQDVHTLVMHCLVSGVPDTIVCVVG